MSQLKVSVLSGTNVHSLRSSAAGVVVSLRKVDVGRAGEGTARDMLTRARKKRQRARNSFMAMEGTFDQGNSCVGWFGG
jgi:hypothetical protein